MYQLAQVRSYKFVWISHLVKYVWIAVKSGWNFSLFMPIILSPTKLTWLAQSGKPTLPPLHPPTAGINSRPRGVRSCPQGKLNIGQINCRLWLNSALGTHTYTHTHSLPPAHPVTCKCLYTHAHMATHTHGCRYHPSACLLPDEHLHPPGGAALCLQVAETWQAAHSLPLSCGRGELSPFICVCTTDSFRGSFHIGALEAGQPPVCFVCVCVWYISSRSI